MLVKVGQQLRYNYTRYHTSYKMSDFATKLIIQEIEISFKVLHALFVVLLKCEWPYCPGKFSGEKAIET